MRYLSGIKPTGRLTLGNYIGALKFFTHFQAENELFFVYSRFTCFNSAN